ncbi:S-layer homology domain-containing protein [Candidatus Peregrinibacteria bacterium]|nr:S-layer homology domain-containing protein [Candidatus Peregrinibacteria bacterium]
MNILKKTLISAIAVLILMPIIQANALTRKEILNEYGYEEDDFEETVDPRIKHAYVTKESFDPGSNEKTAIVFTLTADANIKVTMSYHGKQTTALFEENEASSGIYAVEWDGSEGFEQEGIYTYTIFVENKKGSDKVTGEIEAQDDIKANRKPNIIQDETDQIPFRPKYNQLGISFKLYLDADVTVEIRDEHRVVATVIEKQPLSEGASTIYWNGADKNGETVADGLYQYKIIAENFQGKDVEFGNFEVREASKVSPGNCGNFYDITRYDRYCPAIKWAVSKGIFTGYYDGAFKPEQPITRAEAIKVILKAFNEQVRTIEGLNFGFKDIDTFSWYTSYIGYALKLGIIQGYSDGTFRPESSINRIEALKIFLEAAKILDRINIASHPYGQAYYDTPNIPSTKWYMSYVWFAKINNLNDNEYYFYPDSQMTRGEMADMIYRYFKSN